MYKNTISLENYIDISKPFISFVSIRKGSHIFMDKVLFK